MRLGTVERRSSVEEFDGDALIEAEQVEREDVVKASIVVHTSVIDVCDDRRRSGEELRHKIDSVRTGMRVGAEHVQRQSASISAY